jgi:hypothetical protein
MFALVGILIGICAACLWPTDAPPTDGPEISIDPQALLDSTGLAAAGDNFTWQDHPNVNTGLATELRTGVASKGRAFVRWTQATIDSVVGTGTLVSARLDITINSSSSWSGSGGQLSIHRVTKNWTELGGTANCAIDTNTGNDVADCSDATAWVLNNPSVAPWKAAATDSLGVTNGQTGKISFNVTADLQAFLDDTANFGWVIKPRNDAATGDVRLRSREATSNQPVLMLMVDSDTAPPAIPDGFPAPDSSEALLETPPGEDSVLVLRDFINIGFHDSTSGPTIQSVLNRYNAQVAGGIPQLRAYVVQVPDPGTYAGLESLMTVIRTEPGVRFVARYIFREPLRNPGRYPDDDPQLMSRQDWLGSLNGATDGTRALRVIGAPEAWGCETGLYGKDTIAVGVVDDVFDPSVDDLSPSWVQTYPLSANEPLGTAIVGGAFLSHGTGVAGVLTARGDNATGVAGLVWQSKLHLFRLAREDGGATKEAQKRGLTIAAVIRSAAATPVRVLASSIEAQPDSVVARVIAEEVANFVNTSPGRIFVQASQNFRVTIRPDTIFSVKVSGFLMHQVMAILDPMPAKSRVLFVAAANGTGTDIRNPGGGINESGTTLVTGVTDILAPGEDILTLARPVDFPAGTLPVDGASFAGPMVAGVAAQLWDFYPSLSADEIKEYVMKGAEERIDARGNIDTVSTVPNSGGLYLLNAYQSLARVAREKDDSPVCGFPVYTRDGELFYDRVPGTPVARPVSGTPFLWDVTVAQGGRILSAASPGGWLTFDHLGQDPTALPSDVVGRVYLERDTADLLPDSSRIRIGRADGSADTVDVKAAIAPTASVFAVEDFAPSPTSEWIAVASRQQFAEPLNPLAWEWSIVPVGAPVQTSVSRFLTDEGGMPCGPDCDLTFRSPGAFGWSQDGERLQFAIPRGTATLNGITIERSVMRSVTFAGGTPTGALTDIGSMPGRELLWPRFTADGDLLLNEREIPTGSCFRTWRGPTTGQLLDEAPTAAADCEGQDPRMRFNTPPVAGLQSLPPAVRAMVGRMRGRASPDARR